MLLLLAIGIALAADADPVPPLELLGEQVDPGSKKRLALVAGRSFAGLDLETPVIAIHGLTPGPILCLTAGVHGDEVNGVEIVRRVTREVDPRTLRGSLIAVPIVNLPAFRRGSRYLPDRRDLNRYFPGSNHGSAASRIAHALFTQVIRRCGALVDFHTGSFHRSNIHQLRADLRVPGVMELARGFGAPIVLHKPGQFGTLRRAAVDASVPAITLEAGEPARFSEHEVVLSVAGVIRLMTHLEMRPEVPDEEQEVRETPVLYGRSHWARADEGGILMSSVSLGEEVEGGQVLGTVNNPLSEEASVIRAPVTGRIVGKAFDQLVMPGFAAFHVAVPGGLEDLGAETLEALAQDGSPRDDLDLEERPE